jgi:hypothetical protein
MQYDTLSLSVSPLNLAAVQINKQSRMHSVVAAARVA